MTAYEKELLALAVEATGGILDLDRRPRDGWYYADGTFGDADVIAYPTLVEALTALLRDLGVEVPERPSVNTKTASGVSIRALEGLFTYGQWAGSLVHLRSLYAREPLIVLALLEGGES